MSGFGPGNQTVAYSRETAVAYGVGAVASEQSANAFVVACALVGDVLARPDGHIRVAAGVATIGYPTHVSQGSTIIDAGADFAGPLPSDATDRRYVLALRDVVRESRTLRAPVERTGGLAVWAVVGLVLLAAGVVTYLAGQGITAYQALRAEHLALAQAASDRAEGLRVFRETGQMPSPSPVELAASDAIRRRADREAAAGSPFGDLGRAAAQGARWGALVVVVLVGAVVLSGAQKR